MKNKIITIEFTFLLPCLMTILNYRESIDLFNWLLKLLSFNIQGSHITYGEWFLVAYLVLFPTIQFFIFAFSKSSFGLGSNGKIIMWLVTLICSIAAWHMYSENIILIT